jgi:hypothetical protein
MVVRPEKRLTTQRARWERMLLYACLIIVLLRLAVILQQPQNSFCISSLIVIHATTQP